MSFTLDQQDFMNSLVADVKRQQGEVIEKMLREGIQKGIITVRQSDPVLVVEPASAFDVYPPIRLMHSAVIDYLGAEKIEQLEKALDYMTKTNSDLHEALSQFYEKTKVNTWLKNQK